MTAIQQMVRNILDTRFEDFDAATINHAKTCIIDTVGVLLGGIHSSGVDMVLDLIRQWGGREESTILAFGDRVPAANAVMVMGITARSNDFEPAGGGEIRGRMSPCHNSATTVPTAFAMTEKMGNLRESPLDEILSRRDNRRLMKRIACGECPNCWVESETYRVLAENSLAVLVFGVAGTARNWLRQLTRAGGPREHG